MKLFNTILTKFTFITFLLNGIIACNGQTKNNNSGNQANLPTQFYDLNTKTLSLDRNIRSIFQDSKGNYWFGTNGAGVYRYDTKVLKQFTERDGMADNQVINIQEDALGNIWLGGGQFAISKFDGIKFSKASDKINITKGISTDWISKNNDLWFYGGGGVLRYNATSLEYLPFDPSSSITPFSLSRYGIYCILKDKKGNIWFGTQAEGICRYDGKTLTWFKEKGLAGPAVLGLFEDSKGNLWFGNNGAGLFLYDGKTLRNITTEKGLNNADFRASGKAGAGTLARVYAINEDKDGNIWVGTVDAGVWKYDGTHLTNYTTTDGLTSNAVNTIYKDKNSELWFGTDANGICKFNGTTFSEFIIK